jgi:hypothetical protein
MLSLISLAFITCHLGKFLLAIEHMFYGQRLWRYSTVTARLLKCFHNCCSSSLQPFLKGRILSFSPRV